MRVVAACSVTQVTIELDAAVLSVPHSGGARFVVPRVTPHDHVKVRSDDHELWVEGLRPGRGGKVSLPVEYDENAEVAYLTVDARPHEQRVRAAAAVHNVVVDQQQHAIVQLAVDLPSPLVTPSSEPHFVFILDASVSIGEAGIQQGLRVVRGVLDAAPPGARWAMVTSTRTPRLVVQPWRARDDRFVPRIDVENGSDVAAAMALAQKMASDAVDGRVIVVSDFLLSNHLDTDDRLIASTKGAVTHMIELPGSADEDGAPFSFSRTREDATAQAAERTGGMGLVVSKSGSVDSERTLMRSLVAPTSLDEPRIFINGEAMEDAEAEFIIEGDGLRRSFALPQRVTNVEVRGLLWGEEVRLDMQRLPKRAAIGSAINGSLRNTLDDDVVFAAASTLQFVSRMTSLVEVPTFRPAQPEGFGFGRSGCGCGGCGCGLGRRFRTGCRLGVGHNLPDERPTLEAIGNRIADICRVSFAGQVEIGALEILAVDVKAEQPSAQMCVTELLWRERIDQLGVPEHTFRAQRMREIRGEYSADESAASDGGDESDLAADDDGVVADEDVIDSDAAADEHDSE